jgi:hypothetical protein
MRSFVALCLTALALGLAGSPPPVAAASPAPSAIAPPTANAFQVWLDAEFMAPDAPPGSVLRAGFTLWSPRQREFFPVGGLGIRLHPASGDAEPAVANVESDFDGHLIADFVVPEGGPGRVEVVTTAQTCTADGTCSETLVPIPIEGTGPPPDADPRLLVSATIQPFVGDVMAGRATPVTVEVLPRGLWEMSALRLPDHLVVAAGRRGEEPLASAEILPVGTTAREYTGRLTVPEGGELTLTVAVPGDDGVDRLIAGSEFLVSVIGGGGPAAASPSAASPTTPDGTADPAALPPVAWLLGLAVILVAAVVVLRRVLADL